LPPAEAGFSTVANRLDLPSEDFLANLRRVQEATGIAPTSRLGQGAGTTQSGGAARPASAKSLDSPHQYRVKPCNLV